MWNLLIGTNEGGVKQSRAPTPVSSGGKGPFQQQTDTQLQLQHLQPGPRGSITNFEERPCCFQSQLETTDKRCRRVQKITRCDQSLENLLCQSALSSPFNRSSSLLFRSQPLLLQLDVTLTTYCSCTNQDRQTQLRPDCTSSTPTVNVNSCKEGANRLKDIVYKLTQYSRWDDGVHPERGGIFDLPSHYLPPTPKSLWLSSMHRLNPFYPAAPLGITCSLRK